MFVRRVVLRNYRSIAVCDVLLRPLTILVGPNGSGKSNFLDGMRLVADALRTLLDHALRDRGGIKEVRRRSAGHPTHFGVRLDFVLEDGTTGNYAFRIGARSRGGYEVQQEECSVVGAGSGLGRSYFHVRDGNVESSEKAPPAASIDRLYLVNASGLPAFRPVFDTLSRMGFYNLNPDRIRDLQPPDAGELLSRDGGNLASVLGLVEQEAPETKRKIEEYLSKVVPGVTGVDRKVIGPKETLEFRQRVEGAKDPWSFQAANMSDGTLRALGVLVALFQASNGQRPRVPFVGIEDGLREASRRTQVAITSHSPDLLDDHSLDTDSILAVDAVTGATRIGPIDDAGRSALKDRLYTAGELLRLDQLTPSPATAGPGDSSQHRLFDDEDS